jgi:CBS domain-containing protein
MPVTSPSLNALTAGDLMSRDVLQVSETMPLREAALLLLMHGVSGVPVVEPGGTCVGVLSITDLLRWSHQTDRDSAPKGTPLPLTCLFLRKQREPDGEMRTMCTLPADVCPIQRKEVGPDGEMKIYCNQPHSVLADWQMVETEELSNDEAGQFMTADPVLVSPDTLITDLAQEMVDAHIHRVIVVDRQRRPVGIITGTDILAWVARAGREATIETEVAI